MYRYAYRMCADRQVAEDLVQESFAEAWRSIDSLRDPNAGRAWLMRILVHRHAHALRKRRRRVRLVSASETDSAADATASAFTAGPGALDRLADQELLERVLQALPETYRRPFLLVFQAGLTCREAAEALEVPLGTILSRVHRARIQLRRLVRELDASSRCEESPR